VRRSVNVVSELDKDTITNDTTPSRPAARSVVAGSKDYKLNLDSKSNQIVSRLVEFQLAGSESCNEPKPIRLLAG
jgi:hypothetical protein